MGSISDATDAATASIASAFGQNTPEPAAAPSQAPGKASETPSAPAQTGSPETGGQTTAPSFAALQLSGRNWDPSTFKTPQEWDGFRSSVADEMEKAGFRREDYTRKTQEVARMRDELTGLTQQYEQGVNLYNNLMQRLASPAGLQVMLQLAQKAGWQNADAVLRQLQPPDPTSIARQIAEQHTAELQRQMGEWRLEQQTEKENAGLDRSWQQLSQQMPDLLAHPGLKTRWLFNQLYLNMEPEQAAAAVIEELNGYLDWSVVDKIPGARDRLSQQFRGDYVKQKTQDNQVRPLAGPGGSVTPPMSSAATAGDRKAMRGDIGKYAEMIAEKLRGTSIG